MNAVEGSGLPNMRPQQQQGDVLRTAMLAAAVAVLCTGVGAWLAHRRSVPSSARGPDKGPPRLVIQAEGGDWPMLGGGPQHLGRATGTLADKLALAWTFKTSGPVKSSPAVVAGRVFVGSSDANLYALDLETGHRLWSYKAADAVDAPVCVEGGTVFAGSSDGFLYALDANDGALRWRYQTGGQIAGGANCVRSPKGNGLWIVVGSYDGSLHCVDAQTGQRVWTYKTDNYVNGSPAVADGRCVIGGCDARIHVVSVADGNGITTIDSGSYIAASAATWAGHVYVGNYNGDFLKANVASGQILWRCTVPDTPILTSPAVGEQVVIFGARDKQVHCVRQEDGQAVWAFKALDNVDSSPAICDGKVVFGSDDGRLYMVRVAGGSLVGSYQIGKPIASSPAVSHGVVVVGCDDGGVYAFGEMK